MSFQRPLRTTRSALDVRNGHRDWFRIRNAHSNEAEIAIYDEIGFFGITAADFRNELKAITAPSIALHINSPGGDVFDGVAIYNMLRQHPASITTYVDSLGASIASVIALAGDHRIMATHAQMMIHDAFGLVIGNAQDMLKSAEFLDKQSDIIANIYAERAGGKPEEWRALMAEETWFTDKEAVAAGLAHEIGKTQAVQNSWPVNSIFRRAPGNSVSEPAPEPVEEPESIENAQPLEADWRLKLRHAAALLEVC